MHVDAKTILTVDCADANHTRNSWLFVIGAGRCDVGCDDSLFRDQSEIVIATISKDSHNSGSARWNSGQADNAAARAGRPVLGRVQYLGPEPDPTDSLTAGRISSKF